MYLAHSGVAMAASSSAPDVPMYVFLLASWSPDLTGVGHWVPGAVVLAGLFWVAARRRFDVRTAVVLVLLVASHLVLDLVVGLQIWPSRAFLGLNLSLHSLVELALELVVLCAGAAVYVARRRRFTPFLGIAFGLMLAFAVAAWMLTDDPDAHGPSPARLGVEIAGLAGTSVLLVVADRSARSASVVDA